MSDSLNSPEPLFSELVPLARESSGRVWPALGETLSLKRPLRLKELLAHYREPQLSVRVFIAEVVGSSEGLEGPAELREVWVANPRQAEQLLKRRAEVLELWRSVDPDRTPPNPCAFERVGKWACLIAHTPLGATCTPPTAELSHEGERPTRLPRWMRRESEQLLVSPGDSAVVTPANVKSATLCASLLARVQPLIELLEHVQQAGFSLGGFNPLHFSVDGERCLPRWAVDLYPLTGSLSLTSRERLTYRGYSPPEGYGHYGALPCEQSDVFSVGMWLYYAATGLELIEEARRPNKRLPSPRVYDATLSPELDAVIRRATSPVPSRRYPNLSALKSALVWAAETSAARAELTSQPLSVEVGHEIHVGLLKGQYNPTNQDDLFLGYQAEHERGLFVVTDGVSISEHGSGDIASGYVRMAAQETWEQLSQEGMSAESEEETISELSLVELQRMAKLSPKVVTDLLNQANRSIGEHVMGSLGVFHGPPEGIMAATAVLIMFEGDQALFASMGDSRIYLIRDGHISSLMIDDDLATHLMQMGQTPSQAYQAPSSAALVNCVGEFKKGADGQLIPVPVQPQLTSLRLLPGDKIVLCSDGIPDYGGIDEEDAELKILTLVEGAFSAPKAAFDLISLANNGGGGDNLSCIVLRFHQAEEGP